MEQNINATYTLNELSGLSDGRAGIAPFILHLSDIYFRAHIWTHLHTNGGK